MNSKKLLLQMEKWTEADVARLRYGQKVWPGGRKCSIRGRAKWPTRDGIKHKVRAGAFMAIAEIRRRRRLAGQIQRKPRG